MPNYAKFVLIALALSGGFFANDLVNWYQSRAEQISLDEYCLITTSRCQQGDISVQANKNVSHPLVPTEIQVDWPKTTSDSLLISLQGYEMEMGNAVFKLNKTQSGQFSGQVILPVCTEHAMTWYGTITDGEQTIKTSIRMEQ